MFAQDRVGLWVDTEEVLAPPADHPSSVVSRHTPTESHYYHLLAGTFRPG